MGEASVQPIGGTERIHSAIVNGLIAERKDLIKLLLLLMLDHRREQEQAT